MKKFLLLSLPCASFAQWTSNSALNTPVCTASADQTDQRIISDGANGAIVVWTDSRLAGNTDIYAQRIDSAGNPKWSANGVLVCADTSDQSVPVIASDGSGGAIIAWKDSRNGNSDIYAQHINNAGALLWGANGIAVDTKTGEQIDPKIISNDLGESIIVWQDSMSGNWNIHAQKLNFNGTILWSAGGVAVCTAADDQKNPRIEFDNAGGAIIVWQDKRNGNDYDIYAQRLNSSGIPQWAANGVSVCSSPNTQNNPKIKTDENGGAIIAWVDKRNGNHYDIYAQRINSSGVAQWTNNGKIICSEAGNQSALDIYTQNIDGAMITWKDYRNGIYADIYAQYINSIGNIQWATNGIPISTKSFDQLNPNIITDSSGAIIVWQDSSSGQWDVYGQKILLNGTTLWGANGKIISNASGNQINAKHISDGKGGAIVVFEDNRSGKFDIYAQKVNNDGSLGTDIEFPNSGKEDYIIFPNPNNGRFNVQIGKWENGKMGKWENGKIQITIYNLLGKKVYSSTLTPTSTLTSNLNLNLPNGVYFYKISDEEKIIHSGKIIVE